MARVVGKGEGGQRMAREQKRRSGKGRAEDDGRESGGGRGTKEEWGEWAGGRRER